MLTLFWGNPEKAKIMKQYRAEVGQPDKTEITDWWDGKIAKEYLMQGKRILRGPREIALTLGIDGIPLIKEGRYVPPTLPLVSCSAGYRDLTKSSLGLTLRYVPQRRVMKLRSIVIWPRDKCCPYMSISRKHHICLQN